MLRARTLLTSIALPILAAQAGAQAAPRDVDAYVTQSLKRFDQPGAAIAVVKDGKVVFQQGWGVIKLGEPARINEHTRFQVASNTKAMTAATIAMLVDEGKLSWDDPVADHLPWFRLGGDPYVSRELRVRDLLCHRSGLSLGAGDLLWFHSDYSAAEIVRRLRYIAPATSFRSSYAYDNVLYLAAGELVKAVTGQEWQDVATARLLKPLGMNESAVGIDRLDLGQNVAFPHGRIAGKMQVVPFDSVLNTLAAGGVLASVSDWSKWMQVQLDSGRTAGGRLWSEQQTRVMWSPHINIGIGSPPPALMALRPNFAAYGLGWSLRDYRGLKVVTHDGGLAGMLSRTVLIPEKRLGVVVLTNGETPAYQALAWWVADYYLGAPRTDWTAAFVALGETFQATDRAFEDSAQAARQRDAGPSLPLARYAGRYQDAWYGDATLAVEDGHLVMRWAHSPALTADLEHWQYDTFRARMRVPNVADAFVTFTLKFDGTIDRMTLQPFLPSTDFSFNYQDLLFRPVAGGATP
jgi:CubicO group peptidase (beta-lactamase class C family)